MALIQNRIQMVGTQRSGSNLVRLVLNGIDGVIAPPSAHEYRDFIELLPLYSPLESEHVAVLVKDVLQLIRLNALQWPIDLTVADVLGFVNGRTLADVIIAVYDAAAICTGNRHWVSKCLENYLYIPAFLNARPDLFILHLVRDPRDVALSFLNAPIGPKDPKIIALEWKSDQSSIRQMRSHTDDRRWISIRYEDIVDDPTSAFSTLCESIGIRWTPRALTFHASAEASIAASLSTLWENLSSPIDGKKAGRYLDPTRRDFIRSVEEVAADEMRAYGYEPVYCDHTIALDDAELANARQRDGELRIASARRRAPELEEVHLRRDHFLADLRHRRLNDDGQVSQSP